jgi:hypothetical protein
VSTTLSLGTLEQLAPDQASLNAARGLLNRAKWPVLGRDDAGAVIWGECQGSGSTPYRTLLALTDLGYKCTCPSRKQPCKHTLALGWWQAQSPDAFAVTDHPAWVVEWSMRRKPKAAGAKDAAERPKVSTAEAERQEAPERDERAEARAAAQRERNVEAREASIRAGLDELDQWIADQVARGLAGFPTIAHTQCRLAAQRLTDAKASGLATRLDELPSRLFSLPEEERGETLIQALGGLHLLAEAYRRQDRLPPPLRADVRQIVGWSVGREALIADPAARRSRGRFVVAATRSEEQPDRLRRVETWLMRTDATSEDPAFALLLDFVPLASGSAVATLAQGETFEAEVVFYPSAAPLRALIGERGASIAAEAAWPGRLPNLDEALDDYEARLAVHPWLGSWPMALRGVRLVENERGALWLVDEGGTSGLPVAAALHERALPLGLADRMDVFGLWDGRDFDLHLARTSLDQWKSG